MTRQTAVQFGPFRLDAAKRLLLRNGDPVSLTPRAFDALVLLVEHRDRVVSKDELLRDLWLDTSVEEATLSQHVFMLRRALSGGGDPEIEYIATLPRRGYRFVAPVVEIGAGPGDGGRDGRARADTSSGRDVHRIAALDNPLHEPAVRRHLTTYACAAGAIALTGAFMTGRLVGLRTVGRGVRSSPPSFLALTSRRGYVPHARFAPDGQTIVYGAAWDGEPLDVYFTRIDSPDARPLGFRGATVLAVSSKGELALSEGCVFEFMGRACLGTLARVPLAGGAPRLVAEHVRQADWSPDGAELAVSIEDHAHRNGRLEYPIGRVLYTSPPDGWIGHPRVSPRGDRIAFFDGSSEDVAVAVVDLSGHKTTLSTGHDFGMGLAWSASGDRVWFSDAFSLHLVTLSGEDRLVWRGAAPFGLDDVSPDGRMLLNMIDIRLGAAARAPGEAAERDVSYYGWTYAGDLSLDGTTLLFHEHGYRAARGGPDAVYIRTLDGSPPVRLGEGQAMALSPDGRLAIARTGGDTLTLIPTGPGQPRTLPRGTITAYNRLTWLPDRKHVVFSARESGRADRCYIQDLEGGLPRPITSEGVGTVDFGKLLVTADGRFVSAETPARGLALYPIDEGFPQPVRSFEPGDDPIQWSADSRSLYVRGPERFPARIYRLDLTTGRREMWKQLMPADTAGVIDVSWLTGHILLTPDGRAYVYNYLRWLNDLQLVKGVE
jgi:DNA-binding winged helix-turn-helix (wHTH) protein/Tol biopolymer transport system component